MNWLVLFGELLLAQSWLGSNQAASWATWSVSKDCFQLPKPRSLKLIKFLPGGEQGEGQAQRPIIPELELYLNKHFLSRQLRVALGVQAPWLFSQKENEEQTGNVLQRLENSTPSKLWRNNQLSSLIHHWSDWPWAQRQTAKLTPLPASEQKQLEGKCALSIKCALFIECALCLKF